MSIWEEIPELVDYAKTHPMPILPKRRYVSRSANIATKAFEKYLDEIRDWELRGLKTMLAALEHKALLHKWRTELQPLADACGAYQTTTGTNDKYIMGCIDVDGNQTSDR